MDRTIIYYTVNIEQLEFEKIITDRILKVKGDIPVISVSQKPIDFGENICVGERGYSYLNAFRQLLIGCGKATTSYVIMAESDTLYPESYFAFIPTDPNTIYSYDNVWILNKRWNRFFRKEQTHASMIYGREFLINLLKESLKGLPEWSRTKMGFPFYKPEQEFQGFGGEPIINIITGANGRKGTYLTKDKPRKSLDYWGDISELKKTIWKN